MPHSHNDPGWLKTFEQYFEGKTKNIINNIVQKLHQYPNMTFIWTEISFLNAWWERSHPVKQKVSSIRSSTKTLVKKHTSYMVPNHFLKAKDLSHTFYLSRLPVIIMSRLGPRHAFRFKSTTYCNNNPVGTKCPFRL